MHNILLFTDCSINPKTKLGFGAYFIIDNEHVLDATETHTTINSQPKVKKFECSSSTKLELQTIIWALSEMEEIDTQITAYTDSQNVLSLLKRQEKLETNNYISSKNELIRNHELYKEFFIIKSKFNIQFEKIKGHKTSSQKSILDKYFTLVDRASRKALRKHYH